MGRREKDKKRAEKERSSRSRSKSRGRKRSKSRSRSGGKEKKRRDRSKEKKKKKDKDRDRSRSRDKKKREKREKEEGEMSGEGGDDGEIRSGSESEGKEAAIEAEVRAARERAVVPLETRMKQFRDLLEEKQISAYSTWEKELHKIVFDPRYLLLTSKERKQVFDKYVRERADEERKEKKNRAKERKDAFKNLMEEALVNGRTSYSDFSREHGKDERYKAIEKSRERESQFKEFQIEVRRKEKEEKEEKRKQIKKDFKLLLKETEGIDRHAYWGDVKKLIQEDSRYKAVESSTQKEDWFMDYVHELKDEHRREKEKKKERKER